MEERAWEDNIDILLQKLLKTGHQETVDSALEHLFQSDLIAYDALMEGVESCSESCTIEHEGERYQALLVAAPVLAWTRFSIPSGTISPDMQTTLGAHLHAHLLAADARLVIAPTLYSIDQLPRTHVETYAFTHRMAQALLKGAAPKATANVPETAPFLADTRYVLALVMVRAGEPLFRWQASVSLSDKEKGLAQWRAQATPNVMKLLPGCSIELLLPEAFYVACREADKMIRPASILAAVNYLTNTLSVEPQGLRAIIGAFSEDPSNGRVDEYRIGFTLRHSPEVIYGVVWPLYGEEDESDLTTLTETITGVEAGAGEPERSAIDVIQALLKESGVVHIKRHGERFPVEFCDDCGAPLYPDPDAELVHAEMPEDAPTTTGHFH